MSSGKTAGLASRIRHHKLSPPYKRFASRSIDSPCETICCVTIVFVAGGVRRSAITRRRVPSGARTCKRGRLAKRESGLTGILKTLTVLVLLELHMAQAQRAL